MSNLRSIGERKEGFSKRSGVDQQFDIFDPANANIFAVVAQDSLVTKPVEDRANNRAARSYKVGQLLLRKPQVLSESVFASGCKSARQLVKGLG